MPEVTTAAPAIGLFAILVYCGSVALTLILAYVVIRAAVRSALSDHYLRVQHFNATGVWNARRVPRRMPTRQPEPLVPDARF